MEYTLHTVQGLDTTVYYNRDTNKLHTVKNISWLYRYLREHRFSVHVDKVTVRERSAEEKTHFPTYDCVLEIHLTNGIIFSTMFASRKVLVDMLRYSRVLSGYQVHLFGTYKEINRKLSL